MELSHDPNGGKNNIYDLIALIGKFNRIDLYDKLSHLSESIGDTIFMNVRSGLVEIVFEPDLKKMNDQQIDQLLIELDGVYYYAMDIGSYGFSFHEEQKGTKRKKFLNVMRMIIKKISKVLDYIEKNEISIKFSYAAVDIEYMSDRIIKSGESNNVKSNIIKMLIKYFNLQKGEIKYLNEYLYTLQKEESKI